MPRALPVCFTMDNLSDAADLGRGIIDAPRAPGERPALEQGFPAMLDLFDSHGVSITHFVEGWNGDAHPREIEELLSRGHSLGMHGWQHEKWSSLTPAQEATLAVRATEALTRAAGHSPKAFRAPGGGRTQETARILAALGYEIDASLSPLGDDGGAIERLPSGLWTVPYEWRFVDATHWLWANRSCEEVITLWQAALEHAHDAMRPVIFIWHPHIMGLSSERLAVGAAILRQVQDSPRYQAMSLSHLIATL